MVLYHAVTAYHILKFAVHKLRYHPDEEAVILLPAFIVRLPEGLKDKNKSEIFSKVIYFDWDRKIPDKNFDDIIDGIDDVLTKELGIQCFEDISEINVCRAAFMFGIYLCSRQIPFQWFEEADGRLTNPYPIMCDDEKVWPERFARAVDYGLYSGDSECVVGKMVKFDSQGEGFFDYMAENYDVINEMLCMDSDSQKVLLRFFGVPENIALKEHSAVMMTQHFANMKILSFEDHVLLYQLTADYFLEGYHTYYKWHPSDLMPYEEFIDDASMISGDFPYELLVLIIQSRINIVASISSTGVYNLRSVSDNILIFNEDYCMTFRQNHKYYFCGQIIKELSEYKCFAFGVNEKQFTNMLSFGIGISRCIPEYSSCPEPLDSGNCDAVYIFGDNYTIYDDYLKNALSICGKNDVFIFLSAAHSNCFAHLMREYTTVVKTITVRAIDKDEYGSFSAHEHIYIFTKNQKIRSGIEKMKYVKQLLNTGVIVSVESSENKDAKIAALEGMLKATEAALLKCRQENEEMKKITVK